MKTKVRQNTQVEPKRPKGRPHDEAIRWTLQSAAREFGVHREILARARTAQDIKPGPDEKFTTRQIIAMAFGDMAGEKLAILREDRKARERKNLREEGELIPTKTALMVMSPIGSSIRQKILGADMPADQKDDLLREIERLGEIDWEAEARK